MSRKLSEPEEFEIALRNVADEINENDSKEMINRRYKKVLEQMIELTSGKKTDGRRSKRSKRRSRRSKRSKRSKRRSSSRSKKRSRRRYV